MRILIVTAADENFFPLLQDLIRSLHQWQERPFADIAVLDLGLSPGSRAWVAQAARHIVEPGWDFPVDEACRARYPANRAVTARPFLPHYFPGYDLYLWLDADTWVQERFALDMLIAATAGGALAAVPETHPAYRYMPYVVQWRMDRMAAYFGNEAAMRGRWDVFVNSGVFALRANAPHWALWAKWLGRGLENAQYTRFSDQTALNHTVWTEGLPVAYLPARCNWLCHLALPDHDPDRRLFCETDSKGHALGILHLAGPSKNPILKDRAGGQPGRDSLRYAGPPLRTERTVTPAAYKGIQF